MSMDSRRNGWFDISVTPCILFCRVDKSSSIR